MAKSEPLPGQSLTLRIAHILEVGEDYEVALDARELAEVLVGLEEYRARGAGLSGDLHLSRLGEIVTVRGTLRAELLLRCTRCLAETAQTVEVDLHWRFLPAGPYRASATADEEVELTAEDLDVSFYEGEELDLGEVVREALLLELAPWPVCPEGCAEPLVSPGDAKEPEIDPRWQALAELKRERES